MYAACYVDFPNYRKFVQENARFEFFSLLIDFCGITDMEHLLYRRDEILLATFPHFVKIDTLCCFMSVMDMMIALVKRNDILCSVVEKRRCPVCSYHETINKTTLPIPCHNLDLRNIQASLRLKNSSTVCNKCDGSMEMEVERVINDVIIIDLDGLLDPHLEIKYIQKKIRIHDDDYNFYAFVQTWGLHFVAHVLRGTEWHTYDDQHSKAVKITKDTSKLHPVLLMYGK